MVAAARSRSSARADLGCDTCGGEPQAHRSRVRRYGAAQGVGGYRPGTIDRGRERSVGLEPATAALANGPDASAQRNGARSGPRSIGACKVARFEDIKQRHDMIASAQLATDTRNQDVVRASLGGSIGVRPDPNRFDGVGKLTQLYPAQSGVASFALVDREGKVLQYVTAAPGVNLRPYLGQDVGIQGTLGYMPDAHTQHVTAKRVSVVEQRHDVAVDAGL